jgi:hypothetical protein
MYKLRFQQLCDEVARNNEADEKEEKEEQTLKRRKSIAFIQEVNEVPNSPPLTSITLPTPTTLPHSHKQTNKPRRKRVKNYLVLPLTTTIG